jgi:CheY-like chemotaxis protein
MYVRKRWDVLLVDDEPDVLAVTRLALKHTKVLGIPLKIHECESKAQAIEFFRSRADLPDLSMAIIDVVMESEHAGLELCGYIRGELNNNVTQLIVRTGQAG